MSSQGYTRHIRMSDLDVHNLHIWRTVMSKAWDDEQFRQTLLNNPTEVLTQHGFRVPAGATVRIVQDTQTERHLILPSKPTPNLMVDELGANLDFDPGF